MYGHEKFRTHKIVHQLQFLAASMSRNVDPLIAPVNDIGAQLHQIIHRLGDQLLIPRDRRRRNDDRIARYNRDFTMIGCSHA